VRLVVVEGVVVVTRDFLVGAVVVEEGRSGGCDWSDCVQSIVIDVQVRKMRDEVIPHQEPHQNPVIYNPLQVILKRDLILVETHACIK